MSAARPKPGTKGASPWRRRRGAGVGLALTLALAAPLGGCGAAAKTPSTSLRMAGNVPDASVTIDDEYVGTLAYVRARGVALPPGKHRVTVERVGYFPWDRLVEADGKPLDLQVELVPIPD